MRDNTQHVTIEKDPKSWYDTRNRVMKSYYHLCDSNGELFYNTRDEPRLWKHKGSAKVFLKDVVKRLPDLCYIVTDAETGKESRIGDFSEPLSPDKYGLHEWHKANLMTVEGPDGLYDLWRCEMCRKEVKHYGLSGRPFAEELCPKNSL